MAQRIQEHTKRRATAQRSRADYAIERVSGRTFRVVKPDGTAYVVDLDAGTCTCPDFSRRIARREELAGVWCKHLHLCAASFLR